MTRVVTPRLEAAITNLIGWSDEAMGMLDQRAREVGANHSMVAELGRELRAELLEALRETATPKATLLRDFADVNKNPHHRLYRCEGGELPSFVIVSVFSHIDRTGAQVCEARLLLSDSDGQVLGGFEGFGQEDTGDHDEALRRRGYEVG